MRFSASWKKSIDSALSVKIALINELQMLLANTYYIGQTMPVTVNIEGSCNAASNGDGLFFLVEGLGCSNTARLTDIVYHEFGHSLHRQSIIPGVGAFDGSMSEGAGDFLAAKVEKAVKN